MSRSAGATWRALVTAGLAVFAEHGYEAASVRVITARAKVNQGAITYHFGGKEGLYREVLRSARNALGAQPLLDLAGADSHVPAEALRLFILQTLAPLGQGSKFKRHLRVFAWEQLKPTTIRARLSREEPFPTVVLAERVVRRFMPAADARTLGIATAWLLGQTITFVRDAGWLARPPFGLAFDRAGTDRLAGVLTGLCLGGLASAVKADAGNGQNALVAPDA